MKLSWHSSCHPSYLPGRGIEFRSDLSTYEKEDGIKYHWKIQEEIQHVNSKNKSCYLCLLQFCFGTPGWWLGGSQDPTSAVGTTVSMFYSLGRWPKWVLCVSRANIENSPKEIKRLSKELVHIDIVCLWFPSSDSPGEKGPCVWQVELQTVMLHAVTMPDFVFWSILHI